MSATTNSALVKNAAVTASVPLCQQRGHAAGSHLAGIGSSDGNSFNASAPYSGTSDSMYANSDAITLHTQKLASSKLSSHSGSSSSQPQPHIAPSSVAGEYASLCIATSAPAEQQNAVATTQARLHPAHFRLSEGFDYDLASSTSTDNKRSDAVIPSTLEQTSDTDYSADPMTSSQAVTYGEYASTAVAVSNSTMYDANFKSVPETGFPDAIYTSEEDELDEPDFFPHAPSVDNAGSAITNGSSSSRNSCRAQTRSLPVSAETTTTNNNAIAPVAMVAVPAPDGENKQGSSSLPTPTTLSTFTGSLNGHNATSSVVSNGHSSKHQQTTNSFVMHNNDETAHLPSRVRAAAKSVVVVSSSSSESNNNNNSNSSFAASSPPLPPASSSSSSVTTTTTTATTSASQSCVPPVSPGSSLATAGSGLQVSYQVRRQLIEAALSGGSGSATPVVPFIPSSSTNDSNNSPVFSTSQTSTTSNGTSSQTTNSQSQSTSQQRKDIGHLDMSQFSNLEGKVLPNMLGKGSAVTTTTTTSTASSSAKMHESSGKSSAGTKSTTVPASETSLTNSLPLSSSVNTGRNKLLTSSSRKTRNGGGGGGGGSATGAGKDLDNPAPGDGVAEQIVPVLPIPELSERLAREAKALAGRRSLVISGNASATLSSSIPTSARQLAGTLPPSGVMSQSLHVASAHEKSPPTLLEVSRHHGQIRWTKIIEHGKRIKKAWTIFYCVLSTSPPRLYFFKDEKSAAKSPSPASSSLFKPQQDLTLSPQWSVCTQSDMPSKLQFTRRKNVLFLAASNSSMTGSSIVHSLVSHSHDGENSNSTTPPSSAHPHSVPSSLAFPDVSLGYLIECPSSEQAEVWLRQLLQNGGVQKYVCSIALTSPSSPPTLTKEHHPSSAGNSSSEFSSSSSPPSTKSVSTEAALSAAAAATSNKLASSRLRAAASATGSSGTAKVSLMKLLTGFFKRRPTMEHLKKKGYIRDTVFGSSLEDICRRERSDIPVFVTSCVSEIEARGLETDGLYRTSGNLSQVQKLRCMVDQGQTIAWDKWEIAVLTGALKMFFRELREPLITSDVYDKLTEYATRPDLRRSLDPPAREAYLRQCLAMLPPKNLSVARFLFGHFVRVLDHSASNRMELQSLAIVVAPNLMAPHTDVRSVAAHALLQKYIAEDLIQFYYNIFYTPSSTNTAAEMLRQQQVNFTTSPLHGGVAGVSGTNS